MASMEALWDIRKRGFLPTKISSAFESEALRHHVQVYDELPALHERGNLKARLDALPQVNVVFSYEAYYDSSCVLVEDMADCENVFMLMAILASSYVHLASEEFKASRAGAGAEMAGESGHAPQPPAQAMPVVLPAPIAAPLKVLAAHVERQPILDYAACVLNNWELIDPSKDMSLSNIRVLRTFTRLPAEEWFYKIHIMIEYQGGQAIKAIDEIQRVSSETYNYEEDNEFRSIERVISCMGRIVDALRMMNAVLARMSEECKDYEFYSLVRPWLSSWPAPGVVYATAESTAFEPEAYSGGSGAQSSLMPCFDLFFGVQHGQGVDASAEHQGRVQDPAARQRFVDALKAYQKYMPRPHRDFITHLDSSSNIRDYVQTLDVSRAGFVQKSCDSDLPIVLSDQYRIKATNLGRLIFRLKTSYNEAVTEVLNFRRKHIGFAISYISSQAKHKARQMLESGDAATSAALLKKSSVGTGGSMFRNHLMQHVSDTRRCLYALQGENGQSSAPTPDHVVAQKYATPGIGRFFPKGSVFGRRPQQHVSMSLSPRSQTQLSSAQASPLAHSFSRYGSSNGSMGSFGAGRSPRPLGQAGLPGLDHPSASGPPEATRPGASPYQAPAPTLHSAPIERVPSVGSEQPPVPTWSSGGPNPASKPPSLDVMPTAPDLD